MKKEDKEDKDGRINEEDTSMDKWRNLKLLKRQTKCEQYCKGH